MSIVYKYYQTNFSFDFQYNNKSNSEADQANYLTDTMFNPTPSMLNISKCFIRTGSVFWNKCVA